LVFDGVTLARPLPDIIAALRSGDVRAVKGPTAKMMRELGLEASAARVAAATATYSMAISSTTPKPMVLTTRHWS
jgi:hypothetical protein